MLGKQVGDLSGKITGQRVLESDGGPKVESSFKAAGKLAGVDASMMGTYLAVARPDGMLHGRGQGVIMTTDGGMGSWTGEGLGKFTRKGGVSYRGAIFIYSTHQKLGRLNNVATVFEWEIDAQDNAQGKLFEWK